MTDNDRGKIPCSLQDCIRILKAGWRLLAIRIDFLLKLLLYHKICCMKTIESFFVLPLIHYVSVYVNN